MPYIPIPMTTWLRQQEELAARTGEGQARTNQQNAAYQQQNAAADAQAQKVQQGVIEQGNEREASKKDLHLKAIHAQGMLDAATGQDSSSSFTDPEERDIYATGRGLQGTKESDLREAAAHKLGIAEMQSTGKWNLQKILEAGRNARHDTGIQSQQEIAGLNLRGRQEEGTLNRQQSDINSQRSFQGSEDRSAVLANVPISRGMQTALNAWRDGPDGRSLDALSTVMQHLGRFVENSKQLQNGAFPDANALKNYLLQHGGDPNVVPLQTDSLALSREIARLYSSVGTLTDEEKSAIGKIATTNLGSEQVQPFAHELVSLAKGRISPLKNRFANLFRDPNQFKLMTDESREALHAMGEDDFEADNPLQKPDSSINQALINITKPGGGTAPAAKKPKTFLDTIGVTATPKITKSGIIKGPDGQLHQGEPGSVVPDGYEAVDQ